MIPLILFLAVGVLLLAVLLYLATHSSSAEGAGSDPLREARQAVQALESGLLPPELIGRIFAREDLDYVISCGSEQLSKTFLCERRRIAQSWVGMVRKQILSLRRFHRIAARQHAGLSFRTEAGLAFDFAALLLACRALQVLLYVRGSVRRSTRRRSDGGCSDASLRSLQAIHGVSEPGLDRCDRTRTGRRGGFIETLL